MTGRQALAVVALLGFMGCRGNAEQRSAPPPPVFDPVGVRGILRISVFGPGAAVAESGLHRSVYVAGPDYSGMEDNDLRGFLDGRFVHGWNQPGQMHVRTGRKDRNPKYGEHELFRTLHRWSSIALPPGSRVERAVLTVPVEKGPGYPVRVYLYEVRKDWDPGRGGTLGNNVSPPREGEVWWNDRAYGREPWALPGVSLASDSHPDADTAALPLADAAWKPGDPGLVFDTPALAAYASRQSGGGRPLLFLVKLADELEDVRGSVLYLYSGNTGHSRETSRRPRLEFLWRGSSELAVLEREVLLEHGRSFAVSPPFAERGKWFAASFLPAEGSGPFYLEARTGERTWGSPQGPIAGSGPAEVRLWAGGRSLGLGREFEATVHDTWIRSAPPEKQDVQFTFVSPSREVHRVAATYTGENLWRVSFRPDEVGLWHYTWRQQFAESPYEGAEETFLVVLDSLQGAAGHLETLAARVAALQSEGPDVQDVLMERLRRLERAIYALETPEELASPRGLELREAMRRVREAFGGSVPDESPLEPDKPPRWAEEAVTSDRSDPVQ